MSVNKISIEELNEARKQIPTISPATENSAAFSPLHESPEKIKPFNLSVFNPFDMIQYTGDSTHGFVNCVYNKILFYPSPKNPNIIEVEIEDNSQNEIELNTRMFVENQYSKFKFSSNAIQDVLNRKFKKALKTNPNLTQDEFYENESQPKFNPTDFSTFCSRGTKILGGAVLLTPEVVINDYITKNVFGRIPSQPSNLPYEIIEKFSKFAESLPVPYKSIFEPTKHSIEFISGHYKDRKIIKNATKRFGDMQSIINEISE
ncbi:MAG: hypothetical protein IJ538_00825 [Clostridia bacterium]|nr:hypothetical protein [Clostridia bacterium]